MDFSKEEITQIAGNEIEKDNVKDNPKYEWVDIVKISERPDDLKSNLYLATHSQGEGGWDSGFDRRPTAAKVAYDKGWHLGIEKGTETGESEYLMVRNLDTLAEKLYEHARNESNPYIVGVTGSVGKTTTVAFLEHLIRTSGYDVTRFYSKRLTPLSVMCHYINRVEKETPFIVMEYSTYLKDHVAQLSELLPPNISFLTNIYDTHINPGMFKNKQEIFESKVRIKPKESEGYVNNRVLKELGLQMPKDWKGFNVETPKELSNELLPPTLRTAEMYTVGKLLAKELNLTPQVLRQAFETFKPVENRIVKCNCHGKSVFFHGETSGGSRLWSWFETLNGDLPWLLVEEINFADEDPHGFSNLLEKIFSSDKTFVLDTPINREKLPVKAQFVYKEEFGQTLRDKANGYIVFHKALATRQPDFNPEEYLNKVW
ncbi:hypothetical protein GYA37_03090 [candidate division WWE3 bacterium]|uniref:Mur ligase central domain-containing protein n=1 Tax=candidate division WWE3 bacterium TaxID=2053526 RepID=A0A7X9HTV1_UNCKA|nr:hypothetical protein [candidate division WWE3 bacterium]